MPDTHNQLRDLAKLATLAELVLAQATKASEQGAEHVDEPHWFVSPSHTPDWHSLGWVQDSPSAALPQGCAMDRHGARIPVFASMQLLTQSL